MLITFSRSTSVLESSMLLNIQQPFSKLENTILIPTSPEKVKSAVAIHVLLTLVTSVAHHTHFPSGFWPEVLKISGTSLPFLRFSIR